MKKCTALFFKYDFASGKRNIVLRPAKIGAKYYTGDMVVDATAIPYVIGRMLPHQMVAFRCSGVEGNRIIDAHDFNIEVEPLNHYKVIENLS